MIAEINKAIKVLRSGGTILYPTDTVWGIGCDATNRKAVEKICTLKKRDIDKGFIVLVDSVDMLKKHVKKIPESVQRFMNRSFPTPLKEDVVAGLGGKSPFHSGRAGEGLPLTIIYPHPKGLASNVMANDGSAGIRVTKDEFCRKLIGGFKKPIVSTSANISGYPVPGSFDKISGSVIDGVDYVVNLYKQKLPGINPSKVVKILSDGNIEIIRY